MLTMHPKSPRDTRKCCKEALPAAGSANGCPLRARHRQNGAGLSTLTIVAVDGW